MDLLNCYIPVFRLLIEVESNSSEYDNYELVRSKFTERIEQAVTQSESIQVTDYERDEALFTVIVLIDEAVLCSSLPFQQKWRQNPLQHKYFGSFLGGELFYSRLENIDKEYKEVLLVYFFCLLLGFKGKYIEENNDFIDDYIKAFKSEKLSDLPEIKKITEPALKNRRHCYSYLNLIPLLMISLFTCYISFSVILMFK